MPEKRKRVSQFVAFFVSIFAQTTPTHTQTQITCSLLRNNPLVFRDPPASSLPGAFLVLSLFRNDSRACRSLLFCLQFFFFLNQRESRRRKPRATPNDFFPSLSARRERTLAIGERQETSCAARVLRSSAFARGELRPRKRDEEREFPLIFSSPNSNLFSFFFSFCVCLLLIFVLFRE